MAQKDLKLLWGSNTKISGNNKPAIVDGKAYFAIVDGDTKYPDTAAPENEAFIYFDKDNTRYNVIAKRAIFDALGNKINSTYATDIESSGNTMSLFSADGGEAIDTATIINAVQIATSTRDDTEYDIQFSVNGYNSNAYSLLPAEQYKWGIVSCGAQTFGGAKTFSSETDSSSAGTGAVIVKGGLGVAKKLYVGTAADIGTSLKVGTTATIGTTLTTGGAASIGGDLTVVGKDIFFGNTAGKIVTLNVDADGKQVTLGNASNTGTYLVKLDGTKATSNGIEFWRGSNASWKVVNNAGNFYIQSNYTTTAGDYYDVLKLEYNTGSAILKGKLTAQHIDIGHASDQITYLSLNRAGVNYIRTPNEGGAIAFVVNGQTPGGAASDLIITDGQVAPGTTNATSLGSSSNNWSDTHSRGLTSADTLIVRSAAEKTLTFAQGTTQVGQFDASGSLKIVNNIYPAVNNTKTLGTASAYWNHVYSTNFTGTTFTGDTFTGNAASATKVYVTDTAAPTETVDVYRILFANGSTSNNQDVRFYDSLTYTIAPGILGSTLTIGGNRKGNLQLSDGSDNMITITPTPLSSNHTITISDHSGTMMTSGNYTQWASSRNHTHNVTISHTPAGTISRPTFTGTASQETSTNAGYSAVASSSHTHSYNRVSSVSAHSLSTSSYTSSTNSGSGVAFYAYSGSSKPSLTASIASKCLTVTFTSPATKAYTAAPNSHTHSYSRVSGIANHTVSVSSYTSGTPSATTNVASNGHKHTYTAAGTISIPTFTGTTYTTTETTTTQNV